MKSLINSCVNNGHRVKYLTIILCTIFIFVIISATSMHAYLTATDSRTNVFAIHILIEDFVQSFILMEHGVVDSNKDGLYELTNQEVMSNDYVIYPGVNIPKDPFVKIEGLSQNAYLFIEIVGESSSDFTWSVRNTWMKTSLIGHKGGTVYVYKGAANDAVLLDDIIGASFTAYILSGIDCSPNGGIYISDDYRRKDKVNIVFYGYLIQADGFNDYIDAYNTFIR